MLDQQLYCVSHEDKESDERQLNTEQQCFVNFCWIIMNTSNGQLYIVLCLIRKYFNQIETIAIVEERI